MWQAMVVAMMTPTVLPWITAFARLSTPGPLTSAGAWAPGPTLAFAGGYFIVWLGYSVAAASLQLAVQQAGWMAGDRLDDLTGGHRPDGQRASRSSCR